MDYKAAEKAKKEMKVPVKIIRTDGGKENFEFIAHCSVLLTSL